LTAWDVILLNNFMLTGTATFLLFSAFFTAFRPEMKGAAAMLMRSGRG
jgi:hypothetical protein